MTLVPFNVDMFPDHNWSSWTQSDADDNEVMVNPDTLDMYVICPECNERFYVGIDTYRPYMGTQATSSLILPDLTWAESIGQNICSACYHDAYTSCNECGDVIGRDDALGSPSGLVFCSTECLEENDDRRHEYAIRFQLECYCSSCDGAVDPTGRECMNLLTEEWCSLDQALEYENHQVPVYIPAEMRAA